jgi:hypothetical protein
LLEGQPPVFLEEDIQACYMEMERQRKIGMEVSAKENFHCEKREFSEYGMVSEPLIKGPICPKCVNCWQKHWGPKKEAEEATEPSKNSSEQEILYEGRDGGDEKTEESRAKKE